MPVRLFAVKGIDEERGYEYFCLVKEDKAEAKRTEWYMATLESPSQFGNSNSGLYPPLAVSTSTAPSYVKSLKTSPSTCKVNIPDLSAYTCTLAI